MMTVRVKFSLTKELYEELTRTGSSISPDRAVSLISKELGISKATVVMNLPYINGVNSLEPKSKNAIQITYM